MRLRRAVILLFLSSCAVGLSTAQNRVRRRPAQPQKSARSSAAKYTTFLHFSDKHKTLACSACHKLPTEWTAERDFPDVADFPDHDACVHCHRPQFFKRQAIVGTGPAICTICHVRAAPREAARFAFGLPNNAQQATKLKNERHFKIEFPHDLHQNVMAYLRPSATEVRFIRASLMTTQEPKKVNVYNCSICHLTSKDPIAAPSPGWIDGFEPPAGTFKTMPRAHDSCFDCHWKSQKPTSDDCEGCHKRSDVSFMPVTWPVRKSAKFRHEEGGSEKTHVRECTSCHINITHARTLRGLTPDVPIVACARCHNESQKRKTYKTITSVEDELAQFKQTGVCTYCHTSDVGRRKQPPSHEIAAQ